MSDIDGIIQQSATQYGLDPDLLRAMVPVESGGNPAAVSPKGALGLMQIMPATAQGMGVNPADLTRPEVNIPAGAAYLRQMVDKYGHLDHAVQAYNVGPGAMDAFLAGQRQLPAETVNYLKSVSGNFSKLKQGGASMPTPTPADDNDPIMAMISARAAGQVVSAPAGDPAASQGTAAAGDADPIMAMIQARAQGQVVGQQPDAPAAAGAPSQPPAPAGDDKNLLVQGIEGLGRFGRGVYHGVTQDFGAGLAQNLAHNGQELFAPLDKLMDQKYGTHMAADRAANVVTSDNAVRAREAAYQAATPDSNAAGVGRVVGDVLPMFVRGPQAAMEPLTRMSAGAGNMVARLGGGDMMQEIARVLGAGTGNAVQGAALGGVQPVNVTQTPANLTDLVTGQRSGNDYDEQQLRNMEGGALVGFGLPVVGAALGKTLRYGSNAVSAALDPFTGAGHDRIADYTLFRAGKGSPVGTNTAEIVPGSAPTLAEATGNPGIATLQRTVRDLHPSAFVEREDENAAARLKLFNDAAGDPAKLKSLLAQRDVIADHLYGQAIGNYSGVVTPRIQNEIGDLLERPSIKEGIAVARKWALERNEQPTPDGSLGSLHDVKRYLDDRIAKAVNNDAMREASLLQDTQDKLVGVMEQMSPEYKAAREKYAEMSKPIDALTTLQGLRLTDSMGKITLPQVQNAIRGIQDKVNKPGVNAAQALDTQQLGVLNSLRDDLMRMKNTERGRTAGPTTAQNLATQNLLSQMVPGRMGPLAAKMPAGTIGTGLGAGLGFLLGGPVGAGIGAATGAPIGRAFTALANLHDDRIHEAIVRKLLDPNAGLAALRPPANLNGVPGGVVSEIARQLLRPATAVSVRATQGQ